MENKNSDRLFNIIILVGLILLGGNIYQAKMLIDLKEENTMVYHRMNEERTFFNNRIDNLRSSSDSLLSVIECLPSNEEFNSLESEIWSLRVQIKRYDKKKSELINKIKTLSNEVTTQRDTATANAIKRLLEKSR